PLINHWWNVTFQVNSRGLVAPANSCAAGAFDIVFDFVDHRLGITTSDGRSESFPLQPMSVADFYAAFMATLRRLGIEVHIWTMRSHARAVRSRIRRALPAGARAGGAGDE